MAMMNYSESVLQCLCIVYILSVVTVFYINNYTSCDELTEEYSVIKFVLTPSLFNGERHTPPAAADARSYKSKLSKCLGSQPSCDSPGQSRQHPSLPTTFSMNLLQDEELGPNFRGEHALHIAMWALKYCFDTITLPL